MNEEDGRAGSAISGWWFRIPGRGSVMVVRVPAGNG